MQLSDFINWAGLISIIAVGCCLSIIAIRNSVYGGPHRPVNAALKPFDIKLVKIAGLFFIIAIFFFVVGALM